jgi:TonB-dependent starch-binding outer membrane protein SusC
LYQSILLIMNQTIKTLKKVLLFVGLLFSVHLSAQEKAEGVVTETSGEPLVGANVVIKGTTTGTVTDLDGKFSLAAKKGDVLVISYIGYVSKEVTVDGSAITVALAEMSTLQELVVTGYTTQVKRNVTGAVGTIATRDLLALPSTGVSQALQGRIAGVTVSQEGGPGGGTMVRIRGFGTVGDNEPLYIIDGVPTQSGLNDLNPNDIETIQVLKDASAASIYGSRAGNGVVIVTTKTGKPGQLKLSFDSYLGTQVVPKLPGVLNAQQFADMLWTSQKNSGVATPAHRHFGTGATPTLPTNLSPTVPLNRTGTNWLDEIFNDAPVSNYYLSATGGTDAGSFVFSGGYLKQDGILLHTGYERFTGRVNTQFKLKDRIRVGENLTVSHSQKVGISNQNTENPVAMAIRMPSVIPVYGTDGKYAGTSVGGFNNPQNPVAALTRARNNSDNRLRLFGNAYAEVDLMKGLTAKTSIGIDYVAGNATKFTGINYEDAEVVGSNKLDVTSSTYNSYTWYNVLTYNTKFDKHDIAAYLGTEANQAQTSGLFGSRTGFFSEDANYLTLGTGTSGIANDGYRTPAHRLFSIFGKVDYSFDDFILLSGTVRRDGSSRFSEENRYATFPAFSAGLRLTKFAPFKNIFDELKVRIGWGQTGNQQVGDYAARTLFSSDVNTSYYDILGSKTGSQAGFSLLSLGNQDARWETTTSTNFGIDAALLKDKLLINLDLYNRKTTDMLIQVPQPATVGFIDPPYINIGEMTNKGMDLGITYRGTLAKKVKFDIGANLSVYSNNVDKLGDNPLFAIAGAQAREQRLTRTQQDFPLSYFYGYNVIGIFQNEGEVSSSPTQGFATPAAGVGRFKYQDVNGDGTINASDRTNMGSPHPDFTYGLNFAAAYQGFDLALFLQGSQGNKIYNFTKYFSDFPAVFYQSGKGLNVLNAWSASNTNTTVPKLSSSVVNGETETNSYFLEDGSYLRIKNLQIGYTVPKSVTDRANIERVRVYVQGQNLVTFTKYTGLDPELSLRSFSAGDSRSTNLDIGVDRGAYPVSKSLLIGLNVTF